MTYYLVCNKSNTTDVTTGTGTANTSGAHQFSLVVLGVRVAQSLDFRVLQTIVIVLFHLAIVSSVLRFNASDYHFGTFLFSHS